MRVLLIEDNEAVSQMIELMLKGKGFNVSVAGLGEEGIDFAKSYDYDVVVLDLQLPDMSGYQVLKTLRTAKVKTPVLMLSGNMSIEAKVRAADCGRRRLPDEAVPQRTSSSRAFTLSCARPRPCPDGHHHGKAQRQSRIRALSKPKASVCTSTLREFQILELLSLRKGMTLTKNMVLTISTAAWMSPRLEDHRCFHLQAAQEARDGLRR